MRASLIGTGISIALIASFQIALADTEKSDLDKLIESGIHYEPPPAPTPQRKPKSYDDLGLLDRWRYDSCINDAAGKPTADGVRLATQQCRLKFLEL